MTPIFPNRIVLPLASALLVVCLAGPSGAQDSKLINFVSGVAPPSFDAPEQAADALKLALAADDLDRLATLFGLDAQKLKASEGVADTFKQMKEGAAKQVTLEAQGDTQIVELGKQLWPVPFPIAKAGDGKWAFDTYAGIQEILDRRIGENELEATKTAQAYVEAQLDYFSADRDADGVLEYAQKLISTPGKTDGLYWPADQGDGDSPAGAFPADDQQIAKAKANEGYFGYRFRVLKGQGSNIAGGKYDYVINGNMIGGFGLVAWPVKYGETGVDTFVISKDGIIYQKDLGPNTEAAAAAIKRFNPDAQWQIVDN